MESEIYYGIWHVLWIRDDILSKIVLFDRLSMDKLKAGCPHLGWEYVIKKDLYKSKLSEKVRGRMGDEHN